MSRTVVRVSLVVAAALAAVALKSGEGTAVALYYVGGF